MTDKLRPLPDSLLATLGSAHGLRQWIADHLDGLYIPGEAAVRFPCALLDVAIEHQVAIGALCDHRVYGSAYALLRAQFEAFIRGTWLARCATPAELSYFIKEDKIPDKPGARRAYNFGELVQGVDACGDFPAGTLTQLKRNAWDAMNSYTHGGMLQVDRRFRGEHLDPNYEPAEVMEVLKWAGTLALFSALQIARLAKDDRLSIAIAEKLSAGATANKLDMPGSEHTEFDPQPITPSFPPADLS